jgi:hypothetical protein
MDIEEARAAFKRIVGDSHRASAIIDEIRLMFRHDGMTMTTLDVNALIREVLSLLRGDLENHRMTIDMDLPDGLPPVSANVVQLRQVMVNLITNAADAMSTVMDRQRLLRLRAQAHEPDGSCRGGHRKRHRSTTRRPHFRAVFHDQTPRHGHGAVNLPLHRRTSRRAPFGRAGPDARIDLFAGRSSGGGYAIERSHRRPVAVVQADWLQRHPGRALLQPICFVLKTFSVTLRCERSEPRRATASKSAVADLGATTFRNRTSRFRSAAHPSRAASRPPAG